MSDSYKIYASQEYVDEQIATIPAPDVSSQIDEHNTSDTAHSDIRESINELTVLVGDIPAKVSELENDVGYITAENIPEGLPEGAVANYQLVTDAYGEAKWTPMLCYKEDTSMQFFVETINFEGNEANSPSNFVLVPGKQYRVSFDDVLYDCIAMDYPDAELVAIGNMTLVGMEGGNGEPFMIYDVYDTVDQSPVIFVESGNTEHTMWVGPLEEIYHQLSEEYIPTTIPRVEAASVGQLVAVKAVDENGKPAEWEAKNEKFSTAVYNAVSGSSYGKLYEYNDVGEEFECIGAVCKVYENDVLIFTATPTIVEINDWMMYSTVVFTPETEIMNGEFENPFIAWLNGDSSYDVKFLANGTEDVTHNIVEYKRFGPYFFYRDPDTGLGEILHVFGGERDAETEYAIMLKEYHWHKTHKQERLRLGLLGALLNYQARKAFPGLQDHVSQAFIEPSSNINPVTKVEITGTAGTSTYTATPISNSDDYVWYEFTASISAEWSTIGEALRGALENPDNYTIQMYYTDESYVNVSAEELGSAYGMFGYFMVGSVILRYHATRKNKLEFIDDASWHTECVKSGADWYDVGCFIAMGNAWANAYWI